MGTLVLAGSGEFLPAMRATDELILRTTPGQPPRVAIVPTASGLEGDVPFDWIARGVAHFAALGCEAFGVPILARADAELSTHATALAGADLIYLSGGNPRHLVESLRDTPAWAAIRIAHAGGATLAGSSAGAMALAEWVVSPREATPSWRAGLGLVARTGVLPHFDRFGGARTGPLIAAAPPALTILGIDEDTAIVVRGGAASVSGAGTVSVMRAGTTVVFRPGDTLPADLFAPENPLTDRIA